VLALWLFANAIPGTEYATDATAWLILCSTVVGLLAIGRRIITGPLATEQRQMKQQLTDLAKAVNHLAESVAKLITEVEVIKDRQKRIAEKIEVDHDERRD
jgi:hypothetical protein